MSEIIEALRRLGWTDELIDTFLSTEALPAVDEIHEFDGSYDCIDVTDMTVEIDEPLIRSGAQIKIID